MVKRTMRNKELEQYRELIARLYVNGEIEDISGKCSLLMPKADEAREILNRILHICRPINKKVFKVYIVEKLANFKVFIQIPNGKKAYGLTKRERKIYGVEGEISCDFNIWFLEGDDPEKLTLPTHDYMFNWYNDLKSNIPNGLLFKMANILIRNRIIPSKIVNSIFKSKISKTVLSEVEKFLVTLKWIVLQEDVNYKPPRYMGSKYTLAAYALLEAGFTIQEIRRLIRF